MCKVGFLLFLPKNLFSLHHLHNLLSQGQLDHGNRFAGEVVASAEPARHVGRPAVGEFGKLLLADAFLLHYRVDTLGNVVCKEIGFPRQWRYLR